MARWLKQSTSVDLPIGPFLDSTDGVTAETGLTLTQPDIRLKKNGGAWAQKAAAQTLSHEENGWYEVTLDATDTDTLGQLMLNVSESGALPVWHEFMVVPANVWDSFFGADLLQVDSTQLLGTAYATPTVAGVQEVDITHVAGSAVNTTTAQLGVNVVQVSGDTTAADNLELQFDGTGLTGNTFPATQLALDTVDNFLDTEIAAIKAVTDKFAFTVANQVDANVLAISGDATAADNFETMLDGTGGKAMTLGQLNIVNSAGSALVAKSTGGDGFGIEATGHGDAAGILGIGGATGPGWQAESGGAALAGLSIAGGVSAPAIEFTAPAFDAEFVAGFFTVDSSKTFADAVAGSVVKEIADNAGGSSLTEAGIADAVWDEATAGHTTSGTFGEQLKTDVDAILVDTGTDIPATLAAIGGFIDTEVAAILADTNDIQTRLPAALIAGRMDADATAVAGEVLTTMAGFNFDAFFDNGGFSSAGTAGQVATTLARADAILADTGTDGVVVNAAGLAADAVAEIADGLLDRNMATGTDSGSPTVRTPRQALRLLRNKHEIAAGTLTVTKEDDTTASWTAAITATPGADPITAVDPAS